MRKIRRVISYICCVCYSTFPSGSEARKHFKEKHPTPPRPKGKPGRKAVQTVAIMKAIESGATSAAQISKHTKIPMTRVHSLLSYLRRRGRVRGYKSNIRLVRS